MSQRTEDELNAQPNRGPRRIAIYPGSFDPVHYGHLDVTRRAAGLFDEVIVTVYDRPAKALLFSPGERIQLFRECLAAEGIANASVQGYSRLTVEEARRLGACAVIRGLRAVTDFEYEYQLTTMNRHLAPDIETVFLMTAANLTHLSSSLIKEVAAGGAALDGLVPPLVADALTSRLARAGT